SKRKTIIIHKTEVIEALGLPEGSKFRGYKEYLVQGLIIKPENTLFKLERWKLPNGKYQVAQLPEGLKGHHFSTDLRAYILHQHHHQGVTQPLLLDQLKEWNIDISSGQLNRILIENKEQFHAEKKGILSAGLAISKYIQVDDTGARHNGRNGFCTHIGNELFAWFESTESKSRINFLTLLNQGRESYIVNNHCLEYMNRYHVPPKVSNKIKDGLKIFKTRESWNEHLTKLEIRSERYRSILTEGAMLAGLLYYGFRTDIAILSDDAGQFNIFHHALCWIHAERKIIELIPNTPEQISIINEIRKKFWNIYKLLKVYKKAPDYLLKQKIEIDFNELCAYKSNYLCMNQVLKRLRLNKKELLLVLERPEIPLHKV
ncbi:MAG: transposase, partial [Proteobacteria bacterium]|nr:transposase [Pseudomonadota bacterium]